MKSKQNIVIFALVFTFFLTLYTQECKAHDIFNTYAPLCEGDFVDVPANIGGMTGFLIAFPVAAIIASPAYIHSHAAFEKVFKYSVVILGIAPMSTLFGAPSYLLKKVFWDFPKSLHNGIVYNTEEEQLEQFYRERGDDYKKSTQIKTSIPDTDGTKSN